MFILIYGYSDFDKVFDFLLKNNVKVISKNRIDLDMEIEEISEEMQKKILDLDTDKQLQITKDSMA
ncbi:MAG: hypothetical protein NDI62_01545 [Burkholderiales bacterium]|nr:hypothetical protein [Burkholderiales bacterium]